MCYVERRRLVAAAEARQLGVGAGRAWNAWSERINRAFENANDFLAGLRVRGTPVAARVIACRDLVAPDDVVPAPVPPSVCGYRGTVRAGR
jgi:hypothetical protein